MTSGTLTRRELEAKIVGRAWKDEAFRQELLRDPKRTFEKYGGAGLPPDLRIFVHEEDATTVHLTIPRAPEELSELSDADLEKVAGGVDAASVATLVFITTLAAADAYGARNEPW